MKLTDKEINNLIFLMVENYNGAEIREEDTFIPESTIRAVLKKLEVF